MVILDYLKLPNVAEHPIFVLYIMTSGGVRFRCKHDNYMHKMIGTYGECEWEYAAEAKLMVRVGPSYEIA